MLGLKHGEEITASYLKQFPIIGRGSFTTVRAYNDDQVIITTVDPLKEVYSLGWIDSPLFPKFEKVGHLDEHRTVYTCKRYKKARSLKASLDPDQYAIYSELRDIFNSYHSPRNKFDGYQSLYNHFQDIKSASLRAAMLDVLDDLSNFTPCIEFEISPRNVACDNGKLVLLDLFFDRERLLQVKSGTIKR